MNELGQIVAVEKQGLWVETRRASTCNSCAAQKACGQGLMTKLMPGKEHYIWVVADGDKLAASHVGDMVEVSVPDDVVLKASMIVYLVPLFGLIAGVLLGNNWQPGDPGAIAGGIIGLLFGLGLVRLHAKRVKHDCRVQPRMLRLVTQTPDAEPARVI